MEKSKRMMKGFPFHLFYSKNGIFLFEFSFMMSLSLSYDEPYKDIKDIYLTITNIN